MQSRNSFSAFALPVFALAGLLLAPQPGQAQSGQTQGSRNELVTSASSRGEYASGTYGGGLIELLMTGRDPTPAGRGVPVYNTPQRGAYITAPSDPMLRQPGAGEPRHAALAPEPHAERRVERMLDPRFLKQEVDYNGPHGPGTVVIDTPNRFLYLVQSGGRAMRYGIGVGRPGFEWGGVKSITRKAEWPSWTPPAEMLKRRPDLPRFMAGGADNPMGARAMYLGSSLYRIHGTNEPNTIGQAVSSGCIRMTNDDVTDLYERVRVGMKVIVI